MEKGIMKFFLSIFLLGLVIVGCKGNKNDKELFEGVWLSSSYIRNEFTVFEGKGIFKVYHRKVGGTPYSEGEWKIEGKYFYWRFNKLEGKSVTPTYWEKKTFEFLEDGEKLSMTHVNEGNFVVSQPKAVMQRVLNPPK